MSTSARGPALANEARAPASASPSAVRPFIFQLPAINGRRAAMAGNSGFRVRVRAGVSHDGDGSVNRPDDEVCARRKSAANRLNRLGFALLRRFGR
jgi:hypothetical protein